MNKVDNLVFKVYGKYPCLSTTRYESYYILLKIFEKNSFKRKKILEVGCGGGVYALVLDNLLKTGTYTGIDLEFKPSLKGYKKKIKRIKTMFKVMDARKLAFKNNSFDMVLSFTNLEHIKEDLLVLKEIHRVLGKKGKILIFIPSIYTYPFQFGRHGLHYYKKKEIISKVRDAGFTIKKFFLIGGICGYFFSLLQNWLDFLVLAPFGLYFLIFKPNKLKGNSRQDIGGGLAKKILYRTTYVYRNFLTGKKIHFNLLKIVKKLDDLFPIFPTGYFLVAEK